MGTIVPVRLLVLCMATAGLLLGAPHEASAQGDLTISIDARAPLAALGASSFAITNPDGSPVSPSLSNLDATLVQTFTISEGSYRLVPSSVGAVLAFSVSKPPACPGGSGSLCCGTVRVAPIIMVDPGPPAPPTNLRVL